MEFLEPKSRQRPWGRTPWTKLLSRFANPLRLGVRLLRHDFIAGRFRTIFANVDSKVV